VLDALQQRDAEGQGLAGAGARLADDVVPAEADGDGERLDRERFDDALCFEGICYFGDNPEITKGRQGLQPPSVRGPLNAAGAPVRWRGEPSRGRDSCAVSGRALGHPPVVAFGRAFAREGPAVKFFLRSDRVWGRALQRPVTVRHAV
jgi:hypothetical protein